MPADSLVVPDPRKGRKVKRPMVGLQAAMAQAVVDRLAELDLSQAHLAATLGLSEKHVSHMLTGTECGSLAAWNLMLFTVGVDNVKITWSLS